MLEVKNLTHQFLLTKKIAVKAVDNVTFSIRQGEIFGLVGESGSGKSTIARCVMNIYKPYAGKIFYDGIDTTDKKIFAENKKFLQTSRQFIFQDSNSSLNQRMKIFDIIAEPMKIAGLEPSHGSYLDDVIFQMKKVGLDTKYLNQYPSTLSGGQRQRVAIARALTMNPKFIVADEPIASLDVSMQAQIVNLFRQLQEEQKFSFLFIAHDLSVVEFLCNRVAVIYRGKIVELASTAEIFENPLHEYTKILIASVPIPDPVKERKRKIPDLSAAKINLQGELREISKGHFLLTK